MKFKSYFILFFIIPVLCVAQPANNLCADAEEIVIGSNGFDTGTFTSSLVNIAQATVEPGENFYSTIVASGQTQKSVWFKFSLPTTREVTLHLKQPSNLVQAGSVGFTVYKANSCYPTITDAENSLLSAQSIFGYSFNPCLSAGDYLVQVSGLHSASGEIYVELDVDYPSPAMFDQPQDAHDFGLLNSCSQWVDFNVECQSTVDAAEFCDAFGADSLDYVKSLWFTFTTTDHLDGLKVRIRSPQFVAGDSTIMGYNLYEGDIKTTYHQDLVLIDSCITKTYSSGGGNSINRNLTQPYTCIFNPHTTYTIQLFFHKYYEGGSYRLFLYPAGFNPSGGVAPNLTYISPGNQLGVLPEGTTTLTDYFSCETRVALNPCGNTQPDSGIVVGNQTYNLATWHTFTINETSNVQLTVNNMGNHTIYRMFQTTLDSTCSGANMTDLYREGQLAGAGNNSTIDMLCLEPGEYAMQILGRNLDLNSTACNTLFQNFGQPLLITYQVQAVQPNNNFSLATLPQVDFFNLNNPLQLNQLTISEPDTFGCENTLLPEISSCPSPANQYYKASYRQFTIGDATGNGIPDSGIVEISGNHFTYLTSPARYPVRSILFSGDAQALSAAQNVNQYPDTLLNLEQITGCILRTPPRIACVTPGTYTLVTLGDSTAVGMINQPNLEFKKIITQFANPDLPENMGSVLDSIDNSTNAFFDSQLDQFSCLDNPEIIDGQPLCNNGQKLIYREFYLKDPARIRINRLIGAGNAGSLSLFSGQVSNGINTLTSMGTAWTCFLDQSNGSCEQLDAGWYTVVSYGVGPSYENPMAHTNDAAPIDVGAYNQIRITRLQEPNPPKYNRPHKAAVDSITGEPFQITLNLNPTDSVHPVYAEEYILYPEYFNCINDTPFVNHPVIPCNPTQHVKVAYYVFETHDTALVRITAMKNLGNPQYYSKVYPFDVRTDSMSLLTTDPVQPCINRNSTSNCGDRHTYGNTYDLCNLLPGVYTLVVFGEDNHDGEHVTPRIRIDASGKSRFDHALNAYDFGVIPPDNAFHNGKVGDVNPFHPNRSPSHDIIYCTTGAAASDPPQHTDIGLVVTYNPLVYNEAVNNVTFHPDSLSNFELNRQPRRNLWYTFVLDQPGYATVRVNRVEPTWNIANYGYPFRIYASDKDASLDFDSLIATGQVDSTLADGLTLVNQNLSPHTSWNSRYCNHRYVKESTFYRDPCVLSTPTRYYIVVDNVWAYLNSQVDVEIKIDTVSAKPPYYDYYTGANLINGLNEVDTPYTNVPLPTGVSYGAYTNYTCATESPADAGFGGGCTPKTLWYKFHVDISGTIRIREELDSVLQNHNNRVRLFRVNNTNDTLAANHTQISLSSSGGWGQSCVYPGTYYILLTGCNRTTEDVRVVVDLIPNIGDYCTEPVAGVLSGAGTTSLIATVNCHTIGQDFGEDGSNMGCLIPGSADVQDYKSTWFRIDIPPGDTFDITPVLSNNTNVSSNQITYRVMYGDCNAMTPGSCFVTANTVNTFECLSEGSYFIQVVSPQHTTGNITVNFSAVESPPGCNPLNSCAAIASFTSNVLCENDTVIFTNLGTSGSDINYSWDFGFNNMTSQEENPVVVFPIATDSSEVYQVMLLTTNTQCNRIDSIQLSVVIFPEISLDLGSDTTVCTSDQYTLDATASQGSIYLWSTGETTPTIVPQSTGTYSVTVTSGNCSAIDEVTVTVLEAPDVDLGPNLYHCPGENIVLSIPVNANYTYLWSTNETSNEITVNQAGTYWIQVIHGGCISTDTIEILPTEIFFQLPEDTTVCDQNAVTFQVASPEIQSYSWHDGSTDSSFTALQEGLVWVDISLGNCVLRDSSHVAYFAVPQLTFAGKTWICPEENEIPIAVVESFPLYNWSTGSQDSIAWVSDPGMLSINFTDANGCQGADSILIENAPQMELLADITHASCYGFEDAQIVTTITGGVNNFSYLWSDSSIQSSITDIGAGDYSLTVTDEANCQIDTLLTIHHPDTLVVSLSSDSVSCHNGNDGAIQSAVSGGTLIYSYQWNTNDTLPDISALTAGNYTLQVTDALNCVAETTIEVFEPLPFTVTDTMGNASCYGGNDGFIHLTTSGGTGTILYVWGDGNTLPNRNNLIAGTYTVTITDQNSCVDSFSYTLTQPDTMSLVATVSTHVSCYGGSDGAIQTSIQGGVSPYTYDWNNGLSQNADLQNVNSGTYEVIVTDANNCTDISVVEVTEPDLLEVSFIQTNLNCYQSGDGSIAAIPIGGTAPYTYAWSNNETNSLIENLDAGTYTLLLSDVNNCQRTDTVSITEPAPLTYTDSSGNISCFGGNDGFIHLTASGGTGTIDFLWDDGETLAQRDFLTAGDYTVTISDQHNCNETVTYTLTQPDTMSLVATVSTHVSCYGGSDGAIQTSIQGGVSPYTYDWNNGLSQNVDLQNVNSGTYEVIVTDANNCTDISVVEVTEPALLDFTIETKNVSCYSGNDGQAVAFVSGGTTPYQYDWSGISGNDTVSSLTEGNYMLTVTDAQNCQHVDSFTIYQPEEMIYTYETDSIYCFGDATGAITINVIGGTGAYDYNWSNGEITSNINNLLAGTYAFTVTDENACELMSQITLDQPDEITFTADITDAFCKGESNGSLNLTVEGGIPHYSISWDNGSLENYLTNLIAGDYIAEITDQNGCIVQTPFYTVNQPDSLTVELITTDVNCHGESSGVVEAIVSGGIEPYQYNWNDGQYDGADYTDISAGTYAVLITDANDCQTLASATVYEADQIVLDADINDASCPPLMDGSIHVEAINGTAPYTYTWQNGDMNQAINLLDTGQYTVAVSDYYGCTVTESYTVGYETKLEVIALPHDTIVYAGETVFIQTTANQQNVEYQWFPADGMSCVLCPEPSIKIRESKVFVVEALSDIGCTASDTVAVEIIPVNYIFIPNAFSPNSDGVNDFFEIYGDISEVRNFNIKIHDRWGNLVFQSDDVNFQWDGRFNNRQLESGVLVYHVTIGYENGESEFLKGSVTIVR